MQPNFTLDNMTHHNMSNGQPDLMADHVNSRITSQNKTLQSLNKFWNQKLKWFSSTFPIWSNSFLSRYVTVACHISGMLILRTFFPSDKIYLQHLTACVNLMPNKVHVWQCWFRWSDGQRGLHDGASATDIHSREHMLYILLVHG